MKNKITLTGTCTNCLENMWFDLDLIDKDLPMAMIADLDWICDGCFDLKLADSYADFKLQEQRDEG